jgi:hypothetical protein
MDEYPLTAFTVSYYIRALLHTAVITRLIKTFMANTNVSGKVVKTIL